VSLPRHSLQASAAPGSPVKSPPATRDAPRRVRPELAG
jgi:hypothetical protein